MKRLFTTLLTAALALLAVNCSSSDDGTTPDYLEGATKYDGYITASTTVLFSPYSEEAEGTIYIKEESSSATLTLTSIKLSGLLEQIAEDNGYDFSESVDIALVLPNIGKDGTGSYSAASLTPVTTTGEVLTFDGLQSITDVWIELYSGGASAGLTINLKYDLFGTGSAQNYAIDVEFSSTSTGESPSDWSATYKGNLEGGTLDGGSYYGDAFSEPVVLKINETTGSICFENFMYSEDYPNDLVTLVIEGLDDNQEGEGYYLESGYDTTGKYKVSDLYLQFDEANSNAVTVNFSMEFVVDNLTLNYSYHFDNTDHYIGDLDLTYGSNGEYQDDGVAVYYTENFDNDTLDIYVAFNTSADYNSTLYFVIIGVPKATGDMSSDALYYADSISAIDAANNSNYTISELGVNEEDGELSMWFSFVKDNVTYSVSYGGEYNDPLE